MPRLVTKTLATRKGLFFALIYMISTEILTERLLSFARRLLREAHAKLHGLIESAPEVAFSRIPDPDKDATNQPLRVDYFVEDFCCSAFNAHRLFRGKVDAVGEESLTKRVDLHDLTKHPKVIALMDIIDGTDLLLRGFGNWCSAIIFFCPREGRILGSAVADSATNVFYASSAGAFVQPHNSTASIPLGLSWSQPTLELACARSRFGKSEPTGPRVNVSLADASVCFYGQKPQNFLLPYSTELRNHLEELVGIVKRQEHPAPSLRIYNFGGIPMMTKLACGVVDAVFGQTNPKPHDFAAGAYIALKAGAFLGDIGGNPITEAQIAKLLMTPDNRGTDYILAGSESLYKQLQACLIEDHDATILSRGAASPTVSSGTTAKLEEYSRRETTAP
ncbi:MAG: hypothetical protein LLG20_00390 [Acidobacteriales bacterium]|nr:hypothetical protein [Terriglobales bacterium]